MPKKIFITDVPEMIKMWDYDKNKDVDPKEITVGCTDVFTWKHLGTSHSFHSSPKSIRHHHGCTVCAGKEIIPGINDFLSNYPELSEEWDYVHNLLGPENYSAHSGKEVQWVCKFCGNTWPAKICNRVNGSNCPRCASSRQTSFPEQALLFYINKYYNNVYFHFRLNSRYTLDIFIEDINCGIEYDGYAWHNSEKSKNREIIKNNLARKKGIRGGLE